jgi:hypothetical protein
MWTVLDMMRRNMATWLIFDELKFSILLLCRHIFASFLILTFYIRMMHTHLSMRYDSFAWLPQAIGCWLGFVVQPDGSLLSRCRLEFALEWRIS